MAKRRKSKSNTFNWIVVWLLVFVTLACLAVTFADQLGIAEIPTWRELGAMLDPQRKSADGTEPVRVDFIDVGQGDCTLISANGKHILIDAGENDQADDVVRFLKDRKVDKIDILVGTHPHSDHIGGLDAVIETFSVGKVILPEIPDDQVPTTKTYLDVLNAIAEKNVKLVRAEQGKTFEIGGGKLEILGPDGEYSDLNNYSVVCRFVYDGASFWIAGDCSKEAEADLLSRELVKKTTVFKVSHHGSNTANTETFLNKLDPDYCVISLGKNNKYGHPSKEVSKLLKKMEMPVYRTDLNGTVTAFTDGKAIRFATEKKGS